MTRSRASAKTAGTRAESDVARYLREHVDDRIERRTKTGAKDRGDLSGVRHMGNRVVIEVKNVSRMALSEWIDEAETEAGNDDAIAGVVWHKRRGKGSPGDWFVTMSGADLVALLTGERQE